MGWDRIRSGDQLCVKGDERGVLECCASRLESVRASEILCGTRFPRGIEESLVFRMQLKKWRRPENGLCARAGCSVVRATGNGAPHFQKEQARGMQRAPTPAPGSWVPRLEAVAVGLNLFASGSGLLQL